MILDSLTSEAQAGIRSRVRVLCEHLEISPYESVDKHLILFLAEFEGKLKTLGVTESEEVGLFYLAVFGRYLTLQELEAVVHWVGVNKVSFSESVLFSDQMAKYLIERSKNIELFSPDLDCVLVDISHTYEYSKVTGIQRVVRQFVGEWTKSKVKFKLFRFDERANAPVLLSGDQFEFFLLNQKKVENNGFFNRVFIKIYRLFYEVLKIFYQLATLPLRFNLLGSNLSLKIFNLVNLIKNKVIATIACYCWGRNLKNFDHRKIPIFFQRKVFQPELVAERSRGDFYLAAWQQSRFSLTLIGYDLIPIYNPEHCVVSADFLFYLRLLRIAEKVSCISADVARQFVNFSANVIRLNSTDLVIGAHELSGDVWGDVQTAGSSIQKSVPMVLCVGTIESRKNHLNILRAAEILWKRGLVFELVFAGNLGWLNGPVIEEMRRIQAAGYFFSFILSPSDRVLQDLYRQCAFTVFCSLSEGYGLPIVESLSFGKPCITSSLGCMLDIAKGGGCELVDPYSSIQIAEKMQLLLTDFRHLTQLKSEIRLRLRRTWADYASEVFDFTVGRKQTRV